MKLDKLFVHYIEQTKSLKKYILIKLNQYKHKMNTTFINSENSNLPAYIGSTQPNRKNRLSKRLKKC